MGRPVDQIDRAAVLSVLGPVYRDKPATGKVLRGWVRGVLAAAQALGHVDVNAAGEVIDAALPKTPKTRAHRRALPYADVPAAREAVGASGAGPAVKAAISFTALTAVRSGEARGARWGEVDLEAREWRVPASRMKAGSGTSGAVVGCGCGRAGGHAGAFRRRDRLADFPWRGRAPAERRHLDQGVTASDGNGCGRSRLAVEFPHVEGGAVRGDQERGGAGPCTRGGRGSRAELRGSSDLFDQRRGLMDGQARVRDRPRAYPVTRLTPAPRSPQTNAPGAEDGALAAIEERDAPAARSVSARRVRWASTRR